MGMEGNYTLSLFLFFPLEVKGHMCDFMHPFCVLGLFFCVGQFSVAWYTSNYLSPTIYVFSENGATSMISA